MSYEYHIHKVKKEFVSDVKKIIAECCGCAGQNYKMKIPLSELIEYKYQEKSRWGLSQTKPR